MKPVVLDSLSALRKETESRPDGLTVGFVPTMGYLHEGHLSLVRRARAENERVIVSVFVNPTQFGPTEDLAKYPRDIDRDVDLLATAGADYVFFPTPEMMYPDGYSTFVTVEVLSSVLCGKSRPTHFRGVTTVIVKLVNLIKAGRLYMGEKDFQQIVVLERMLADLNIDARIVHCPLVRESDGLALSSRNLYLSPDERTRALCLSEALKLGSTAYRDGERDQSVLVSRMRKHIEAHGGEIDYVEIIDPRTLMSTEPVTDDHRIVLAVRMGATRLIDNCRIGSGI